MVEGEKKTKENEGRGDGWKNRDAEELESEETTVLDGTGAKRVGGRDCPRRIEITGEMMKSRGNRGLCETGSGIESIESRRRCKKKLHRVASETLIK